VAGEIEIVKPGKGAFYATPLEQILQQLGVTHLLFTGVTTEVCVQTSMREANDRGYECLLVEDGTESYFPELKRATLDMITAQGGDVDAVLPVAVEQEHVVAERDGILTGLDALDVGIAAWRLGAGRARKEDPVQAGAGVEIHVKPGERVVAGQPLLTLHTDTPDRFARALESARSAVTIEDATTAAPRDLVITRID